MDAKAPSTVTLVNLVQREQCGLYAISAPQLHDMSSLKCLQQVLKFCMVGLTALCETVTPAWTEAHLILTLP